MTDADLGLTVEGENEAAATEGHEGRQTEAQSLEKENEQRRMRAFERAQLAALRLYRACAIRKPGESVQGGRWDIVTPDSPEETKRHFWRMEQQDVRRWHITGDTNDGMASLDFYGWKPVALIWDACGCLLGYFVEDTDLNSDDGKRVVYGHAIGVCEGVTNTDCLNGLHIEDFVSA